MKKMMLMLVALLSMTVAMAQNENGRQPRKMDAATVTTMMTQKLGLNAQKVRKCPETGKRRFTPSDEPKCWSEQRKRTASGAH